MILTCPSCSAKFMISSEALGPEGREVRCGKCSNMWFQPPERDSLDELPVVEDEDPFFHGEPQDQIAFTDHKEPDEANNIDLELRSRKPAKAATKFGVSPKLRHAAAALVALAIVMVLFYALVAARHSIASMVPFFGGAYEKLGFPIKREIVDIAFDRIQLRREGPDVKGSGYIINLTAKPVKISQLSAELTDLDYKPLNQQNVEIEGGVLNGEDSRKIEFTFKDAPSDAVSVRLKVSH